MRFLEKIFQSISEQVLPTACIVCEYHQKAAICNNCLLSLHEKVLCNYECCYQCGIALHPSEIANQHCEQCKRYPPYFDASYCLDRYEGSLQNALHQLKYQKRLAYAVGLAKAWNAILAQQLINANAAYLLPVPLSYKKLALRGFNQSWEIARRIECGAHIQKNPYTLKRHHFSEQQAGNKRTDRNLAIQGMFYLEERHLELLQDHSVIIFDDVMTSGATLNEIARVLKDNGVKRVTNWVLLRTSMPSTRN